MSVFSLLAQHADMAVHNLHVAGAMVSDAALHGKLAVEHASDHLVVLAQADSGPITGRTPTSLPESDFSRSTRLSEPTPP